MNECNTFLINHGLNTKCCLNRYLCYFLMIITVSRDICFTSYCDIMAVTGYFTLPYGISGSRLSLWQEVVPSEILTPYF